MPGHTYNTIPAKNTGNIAQNFLISEAVIMTGVK